jgi:predicted  nucleic acid-binding Zn-ribbon protein
MDTETFRVVAILAVIICGVPGTIFVLGPIARAIAERIAGRPRPDESENDEEALDGLRGRLESSERQLADVTQRLETTQQRLMDVEERLDFAERLLTRHADAKQLGRGE